MAIDGRDIARPKREKELYESPGARIAGIAIVAVPLLAIVIGSYWVGEWTGGVLGGILSVVSTALTVGILWLLARRKRR